LCWYTSIPEAISRNAEKYHINDPRDKSNQGSKASNQSHEDDANPRAGSGTTGTKERSNSRKPGSYDSSEWEVTVPGNEATDQLDVILMSWSGYAE